MLFKMIAIGDLIEMGLERRGEISKERGRRMRFMTVDDVTDLKAYVRS